MLLHTAWQGFDDLWLGSRCAGCGGPPGGWCAACAPSLAVPFDGVLPGLAVPVAAAGCYAGPVRSAIVAYKEHGRWSLARPLGDALARAVSRLLDPSSLGPPTLVPMPSSRAAVRRRGDDHALRLARAAARRLASQRQGLGRRGRARVHPLLRPARAVADQAGLSRGQRRANLAGALTARGHGRPRAGAGPLVVVDDVLTTGASAAEAVRALTAAGYQVAGVAVVALTPSR